MPASCTLQGRSRHRPSHSRATLTETGAHASSSTRTSGRKMGNSTRATVVNHELRQDLLRQFHPANGCHEQTTHTPFSHTQRNAQSHRRGLDSSPRGAKLRAQRGALPRLPGSMADGAYRHREWRIRPRFAVIPSRCSAEESNYSDILIGNPECCCPGLSASKSATQACDACCLLLFRRPRHRT